jgi:hypothetical protein
MGGDDVRLRLGGLITLGAATAAGIAAWILNAHVIDHWLAVHTGTINEAGPYYAFWSGFGSDLSEVGLIGVVGTGVYQIIRKYNCHQPGCWRVGNHAAAGGQFFLCYRHHPDLQGVKPTSELIARLHRDHIAWQEAVNDRLTDVHRRPPRSAQLRE